MGIEGHERCLLLGFLAPIRYSPAMHAMDPNGVSPEASARGGASRWVPLIALWGLVIAELAAILALNDGHLMYTLDDPYIHLALAENLIQGHFGLNPSEVSAPSSSILWPFLLAPFTALGAVVEWVPLLLNSLAASLTLLLVGRSFREALAPLDSRRLELAATTATLLAIPALNLVGLVFTGMEHSFQVLFAVLLTRGVLVAARESRVPRWLLVAMVVGPLVRYENAALSASAFLWLWFAGERGRALACAACCGVLVGAYSFFLHSLGLHYLPTSVLAKSAAATPGGGLKPVLYGLYHNLSSTPGLLMSLGVVALVATGLSSKRSAVERRTALCFAAGLFAHLIVGRFGWYSRYEIYAWSAGVLVCVSLWGGALRAWVSDQSPAKTAIVGLFVVGIACREYVIVLANNSLASNNVYQQHYSMHRFVQEFWREPIAVNDLGWVAFRNEEYVLDLWGLASLEALEARQANTEAGWLGPLAEAHGIRAAMIYEKWFPGLPEGWRRVGELRMGGPRVTPADNVVAFYATDENHVEDLRERMADFEAVLPSGASLRFE